jgi:fructoselysine-6-P-deglycase FrlB-like protein
MRSIEAMNKDIEHQIEQLGSLELPLIEKNIDDCFFTGSGDSYVASLIGSYASNFRAKCCHPMDIVLNPKIVSNRKVFLVSVSGATKATLLAANLAKKYAQRTISITSKPDSPLGKISDKLFRLGYKSEKVVTSGTIGFTASMLCCISLVRKVKLDNIQEIYNEASVNAELLIDHTVRGSFKHIFLGNGLAYPAALYGSLKMNEVFGVSSFAYNLDDFCHAPIFGVKPDDRIIILANSEGDAQVGKIIASHMGKENVLTFDITSTKQNMVKNLLEFIFFSQLYPAKLALTNGLKDCYFLRNKELLALSSSLIYS